MTQGGTILKSSSSLRSRRATCCGTSISALRGIIVEDYKDEAEGEMVESADEGGRFTSAVLHPVVTISGGDLHVARELHDVAHRMCFIANSVNFPVRHEATITTRR